MFFTNCCKYYEKEVCINSNYCDDDVSLWESRYSNNFEKEQLLNPVEVFKELIANKDDRVLIPDDELAMIETVQDIFDYCGYTMYVKKKD